jgi:transposase-like protein
LLCGGSFLLEYTYNGWRPGIDEDIVIQTSNASGIRDIARNLGVSKQKVQDTLKKRKLP